MASRKRNKKNLEVKQSSEINSVAEDTIIEPQEKTIFVAGRIITVFKATFQSAMVKERIRREMISLVDNRAQTGYETSIEEQTIMVVFYPAMMACSRFSGGEPFTVDEFANLPELEINDWYVVVNELNPHWFPKDPDGMTDDEVKKNNN